MGNLCATNEAPPAVPKIKELKKKIVVVGPASVGKTTIISQLIKGEAAGNAATTNASAYERKYQVELRGKSVQLVMNVWDTPGGTQYSSMRDLDYADADACILVYSIDSESTFA